MHFLVDDNRIPLKQSRLPGSYNSYFNHLMLSSYINHLDYYFEINDHIFLCVGNNLFYRNVESKALSIFGETLCMRWNCQNSNLKKKLMDYLEGLFGVDTFNTKVITSLVGEYLKYTWDVYR
jgi:hypothetical protein